MNEKENIENEMLEQDPVDDGVAADATEELNPCDKSAENASDREAELVSESGLELMSEPADDHMSDQLLADSDEPIPNENVDAPADKTPDSKAKKKKLPKWLRRLIKLVTKVAVLVVAGLALWHWVGNVYITHDNNMYPHIKDGDLVATYKLNGYYNGNVVLYDTDSGKKIGRIIASGGDEVLIQSDGLFTVNGSIPYENVYYLTMPAEESEITYPYVVPEGEYFILNDMREVIADSRVTGTIPEENLRGTVQIIVRHRGM